MLKDGRIWPTSERLVVVLTPTLGVTVEEVMAGLGKDELGSVEPKVTVPVAEMEGAALSVIQLMTVNGARHSLFLFSDTGTADTASASKSVSHIIDFMVTEPKTTTTG